MAYRARLSALLIGLVLALVGAQSALADDPTLYVQYTLNCTFSLTGDNGAAISVIPPGRYQVVVTSPQSFAEIDLSGVSDPNLACGGSLSFRITGPGVNLHTTLEDGDATADQLQATFQAGGSYTAFEDHRPTVARVPFTVVSGATPTGGGGTVYSGGTNPKPAKSEETIGPKVLATLAGSVSTAGKLTLTLKGKRVSSLKAGRYKISVLDETSKSGFTIQKLGTTGTNVTSTKLVGKHSVTLVLKAGQWFYYSPGKKKAYFIVHA